MTISEVASDYISRKQLAIDLGNQLRGRPYSEFTLIAWEKANKGPPATRIGRDVFYRLTSVQKWLQAREQKAAA